MNKMSVLSSIKIIPTKFCKLHEPTEFKRLKLTKESIQKRKILTNPIMVTEISKNKYLVLDGAHRFTSLKLLGYRYILAQVVGEDSLQLDGWNHLLMDDKWLDNLKKDKELFFSDTKLEYDYIAKIYNKDQVVYIYSHEASNRLYGWHTVVNSYSSTDKVIRIPKDIHYVPKINKVLLKFPSYALDDIKKAVLKNNIFPAGVTRFIVDGRILNLNIPLSLLESSNKTEELGRLCVVWSQKLRLYSKSVYVYEP